MHKFKKQPAAACAAEPPLYTTSETVQVHVPEGPESFAGVIALVHICIFPMSKGQGEMCWMCNIGHELLEGKYDKVCL